MESELPFAINGYRFLSKIGSGGFSKVYKVFSDKFQQFFVAKVVSNDPEKFQQLKASYDTEIESLMHLNHPHIIRLYDHFYHRNCLVMILEFCERGALSDELSASEDQGLRIDRFITVARQLVLAIDYCHSHKIAHHDIKPSNVLIDAYDRIKLADFGLALNNDGSELSCRFAGSVSFLSPEIYRKIPHDPFMADIWALGVTFAFMVNGGTCWSATSPKGLEKVVCMGLYTLNQKVPVVISDLLRRMLALDPKQRITAEQLKNHPLFDPGKKLDSRGNIVDAPASCITLRKFPSYQTGVGQSIGGDTKFAPRQKALGMQTIVKAAVAASIPPLGPSIRRSRRSLQMMGIRVCVDAARNADHEERPCTALGGE